MRVSDQHPAVSRPLAGFVAVVFGGKEAVAAGGAREAALYFRAAGHFFVEDGLMVAIACEELVKRPHDSHAQNVVVQRNIPEPAPFALGLDNHGGAFIPPFITVCTLEVA